MRKISPPPGFDPRPVQPVASCYTDWATGPTVLTYYTFATVLIMVCENHMVYISCKNIKVAVVGVTNEKFNQNAWNK
jgi:hypothetical protein